MSHFATPDVPEDHAVFVGLQEHGSWALQHATPERRADRLFVLHAVAHDGEALMYAATPLQSDAEVVLAAVSQNGHAFRHAAEELRGSYDFALEAIWHVSQDLRKNHEFSIAAVNSGCSLEQIAPAEQAWMAKRDVLRERLRSSLGSRNVDIVAEAIAAGEAHGLPAADLQEAKNYFAMWTKYIMLDALMAQLKCGADKEAPAVVLVKGSWLLEYAESGGLLPRRQDLPDGAVWTLEELEADFVEYEVHARYRRPPKVIAISHPWLRREHPDPSGALLKQLVPLIRSRLQDLGPESDIAIFLDYCSLHQQPRTPGEEALYVEALRGVGLWYASLKTETWLLTRTPDTCSLPAELGGGREADAVSVVPTDQRGWMAFERAVAALVATEGVGGRNNLVDVGAVDATEDLEWKDVARNHGADRFPPVMPGEFSELLATKVFSKPEDLALLQQMYREIFEEVMASTSTMILCDLGWGDEEATGLATAITCCAYLRGLELEGNQIADEGVTKLMEAVAYSPLLDTLILRSNDIGDAGAIAMAEHLPACKSLQELDLSYNSIGNEGAVAFLSMFERGGLPALTDLNLQRNDIGKHLRDRLKKAAEAAQEPGFELRL